MSLNPDPTKPAEEVLFYLRKVKSEHPFSFLITLNETCGKSQASRTESLLKIEIQKKRKSISHPNLYDASLIRS